MQNTNNTEWKENYEKTRSFIKNLVISWFTIISGLYVYVYQTIISKIKTEELLASQIALELFTVGTLVLSTVGFYYASHAMSKTYRDEGLDLKDKGCPDVTLMKFTNNMDLYYRYISIGVSLVSTLLFTFLIFMLLEHAFSFSTAVIFSGIYLISIALTFPNICTVQARKKTFLDLYLPGMTLNEMKNLKYEIAKTFKGQLVYPGSRQTKETPLSKKIYKSKVKLTNFMYGYIAVYITVSVMYALNSYSTVELLDVWTIKANTYYLLLCLITVGFLAAQRYLYAQVSGGNGLKRKKLCKVILGEKSKKAA